MFNMGLGEIVLVLLLVILVFGGKRLPALGNSLGQAIFNFKKELGHKDNEDDSSRPS